VRTVERELLLRCSSEEEAETWRKSIMSRSIAPLFATDSGQGVPSSVFALQNASVEKQPSDSLIAEDGDSLDVSGISIAHRVLQSASECDSSRLSSFSSSTGAFPGWDGKKNSLG
jgi:hypothetical protein